MNKISPIGGTTLLAVACLTIMVGCVIVPGLPAISSNLNVEKASGWLVTLPALGVVILGPLTVKIINRIGLYRTLCVGLFLYGFLGASGAFLPGYIPLLINRFLLGGATALVMTAGTGLISAFYQGSQRLKMIALQGMSIELGGVVFLFIGGVLASIHWATPFVLYLFAWVLLAMVFTFVPKDDLQSNEEHYQVAQMPASHPAIKITWAAALGSMIIFFTAIILLPLHFKDLDITASQTGIFLSFISLVAVGAAWAMPRMVKAFSESMTLVASFLFYAIGHCVFSIAPTVDLMIPGAIAMGIGFGLSVPLVNHLIVALSPTYSRSENLAKLSMAIFSGQFLSSLMVYLPGSLTAVFSYAALFSLFISLALCLGRKLLCQNSGIQQSDK